MAWHITFFLKSLRSLEEFRKTPHVKIPPKSPSTNFPCLGKFKIQILIQKSFFFTFGPANLAAHSAFGPAGLPLPRPRPADRPKPPVHSAQPASPRMRWCICKSTSSSLIHASRHRRLLSLPSLTRGPRLSASSSPPRRRDPGRVSTAPPLPVPPAPRRGCR
jgi:hypothetical protein